VFGLAIGIGSGDADHNYYVELFSSNPKLEKEFGPIEEYGSTDKVTAWLYEQCISDPNCGY
jgi:hypothetical protein